MVSQPTVVSMAGSGSMAAPRSGGVGGASSSSSLPASSSIGPAAHHPPTSTISMGPNMGAISAGVGAIGGMSGLSGQAIRGEGML